MSHVGGRRAGRLYRIMLACVREHDWGLAPPGLGEMVDGADLTGLVELAARHRVSNSVYLSLRRLGDVDAVALAALEAEHLRTSARRVLALADLLQLRHALAGSDVPWLVVKGPVLSEVVYGRSDLRSFHDLDLLVAPPTLGETIDRLETAGFEMVDENWKLLIGDMKGEVHLSLPHGNHVDLHWHLLNDATARQAFRLPTEALVERARVVTVGGVVVRTLDPADTIVHVAVHACQSGGSRLAWMKDLEQCVLRDAPDWPSVVERAHASGLGVVVGVMLAKTARLLAAPVPTDVVSALAPGRTWSALTRAVSVLPSARRGSDRGPASLVARATRTDLRSSGAELARRTGAWMGSPGRRGQDFRLTGDRPTDPRSLLYPTGGAEGRAAFLDSISRLDLSTRSPALSRKRPRSVTFATNGRKP